MPLLAFWPNLDGAGPPPPPPIPYFRKSDITRMLRRLGEDVTIHGTSTKGLVDRETDIIEQALGGPVHASLIMVTIETDTVPGLTEGVTATVQGRSYKVWKRPQVGDGAVTQVFMEKA
jgi:hypothetical protein